MGKEWKTRYGIDFPIGTSDYGIEKSLFRYNQDYKEQGGSVLTTYEHFRNAIQLAYNGHEFKYNSYTDRIVYNFCEHDFLNIWGSGGVGKSCTVAVIINVYWDCAPDETLVSIFTSSIDKQNLRVFGEVVRYNNFLRRRFPDRPMRHIDSKYQLVFDDPTNEIIKKNAGVFAFGVANKDDRHKVNSLSGLHGVYNLRVVDEANAVDQAVYKSFANFLQGGIEHKVILMANPDDWNDLHGQHSVPVKGIEQLNPEEDKEWQTTKSFFVVWLDGLDSPAIHEEGGERKYPFLPNRRTVKATKELYGEDSLEFWQQVRGFMPPSTLRTDRVLTQQLAKDFHVQDDVQLREVVAKVAAFDPATTEGGDRKILTFATLGIDYVGRQVIRFEKQEQVKIELSKAQEYSMQLSKKVIERCKEEGVQKRHFGIDNSGTDGCADTIDVLWDDPHSIHRTVFIGPATDRRVSSEDPRKCCDVFDRKVSELWMMMKQFTIGNQIRGLPDKPLQQFCDRKVVRIARKWAIISKQKMTGDSPDEADSCVVLIDLVRDVFGWDPEIQSESTIQKSVAEWWMREYEPENERDIHDIDDEYLYGRFELM